MQNAALSTATGCTQDANIQHLHDETLIIIIHEHLQIHASQYKHNIHHTPYINILQHSNAKKNPISSTPVATQKYSHIPPHSHHNRHKTNMRHIHTYIHTCIVSTHLATRGHIKILRTPPAHISNYEEILLPLIHRTLVQLGTNKSPFLKSYLHRIDAKSHPSQLWPHCNTRIHNTHTLFNCTHIHTTLDLWTDPAGVTALVDIWTEKLAGGPQSGRSDSPPHWQGLYAWVDKNTHSLVLNHESGYCISFIPISHHPLR